MLSVGVKFKCWFIAYQPPGAVRRSFAQLELRERAGGRVVELGFVRDNVPRCVPASARIFPSSGALPRPLGVLMINCTSPFFMWSIRFGRAPSAIFGTSDYRATIAKMRDELARVR